MSFAPAFLISLSAVIVNVIGAIVLIATGNGVAQTVMPMLKMVLGAYLILYLQGIVCTLTEWKHIHTNAFKKIFYTFTFPLFIFSFIPCCFSALFTKVEWKQIHHKAADSDKISLVTDTEQTDAAEDTVGADVTENI
jgi:hypothetical protein